ncbi:MAG: hypothetical protein LBI11_06275 [Streptococcaceae bacterium]|jgi:uncharacterized membrane protein YeiH|nr:hypothetical protein [Streptococcaceae bacterium]
MFYLVLIIPTALIYFFLVSDESKKTLNIFFVLGGVTLFVTAIIGFVFNYQYNIAEIIFYVLAVLLLIESVREMEKM